MLLQLNICSLVEIETVLALVRPPVMVHPPILVSQNPLKATEIDRDIKSFP